MDRIGRYKTVAKAVPTGADEVGKRFPVKLPPWHEKYLIWWAAMKGASKTGLAQNVIQARTEACKDQIEEMLADRAKDMGITVDELKAQLLKSAGFSAGGAVTEDD